MTNNLRIISDNAANRATVTATPIAAGMSAAAMLNDTYANVCRSTGTSMSITMTWPTVERIGGWGAPWCNGSPTLTVRVRGYSDVAGTDQVLDTGVLLGCPWPAIKLLGGWTPATSASAYAYGGGAPVRAWFSNVSVRRLDIDLVDVGSLQGYIEVSRLFVGEWWSPARNADYNISITPAGTGTAFRDGAGGRRSTRGTKYSKISLSLSHMNEADRSAMWALLMANGSEIPFLFSMYPLDALPARERTYQGYCVLVVTPAMRRQNCAEHATALEMETM